MIRKFGRLTILFFSLIIGFSMAFWFNNSFAANINETEPNNTSETANPITKYDVVSGEISATGDVDFYSFSGVNSSWGIIALLDTSGSSSSTDGSIKVYKSDGSTLLQSDSGSWSKGSVIAWQNYASGSSSHYIHVSESGDDNTITPYTLTYYSVAMSPKDEVEPNNTSSTGNVTAKVNNGVLDNSGDVDCYRFYGKEGQDFLFALNADPENDGSTTNFAMTVYSTTGSVMNSVDFAGAGGNEVIRNITFTDTGTYAFCVYASGGATDATATYLAGILRNETHYNPYYAQNPTWLNPGPNGYAFVGDILEFELVFTNTTPLTLPQQTRVYGTIDDSCLSFVSTPGAVYSSTTQTRWEFWDIPPNSAVTATFSTKALAVCSDNMHQSVSLDFYSLGVGSNIYYDIYAKVFLPLVIR